MFKMASQNQYSDFNSTDLTRLFEEQKYQDIIQWADSNNISPSSDPSQAFVIAAALFKNDNFTECLLWCESIAPSVHSDSFYSLHAATLRRVGKLEEAEKLFTKAINEYPQSQTLQNNFANLLIDQKKFSEAEEILQKLLKNSPEYEDARQNMNRLKLLRDIESSSTPIETNKKANKNTLENSPEFLSDPLYEAFTKEEVAMTEHLGLQHRRQEIVAKDSGKKITLPERAEEFEIEEFFNLARNTIEINPSKVIGDCNYLHSQLGVDYRLYALAGEAYIRLQLFSDAENSLLTALALGCTTDALYCNLANLAAMRGDQLLALTWLEKLAAIEPDNSNLLKVKNTLFNSGLPRKSVSPYQLNLEHKAPGQFKKNA